MKSKKKYDAEIENLDAYEPDDDGFTEGDINAGRILFMYKVD